MKDHVINKGLNIFDAVRTHDSVKSATFRKGYSSKFDDDHTSPIEPKTAGYGHSETGNRKPLKRSHSSFGGYSRNSNQGAYGVAIT